MVSLAAETDEWTIVVFSHQVAVHLTAVHQDRFPLNEWLSAKDRKDWTDGATVGRKRRKVLSQLNIEKLCIKHLKLGW